MRHATHGRPTRRSRVADQVEIREVSVVIPAMNAEELIGQQLDALCAQTDPRLVEIIVADNGSQDQTPLIVSRAAESDPRVRLVMADSRPGPSFARNEGTKASRGDLVLYCDADDVVADGWVRAMVDSAHDAELVGGRIDHHLLNPPDVSRWRGGGQSSEFQVPLRFLPFSSSANLAIHRAAWEDLGGFDDSLPFGEDVDLSWRAQLRGYRLAFAQDAVVQYRHRHDVKSMSRQAKNYAEGEALLYQKFRVHGARRRSFRVVFKRYIYLLTRLPYLCLGESRRGLWFVVYSDLVGHLVGSVRHRVFCP